MDLLTDVSNGFRRPHLLKKLSNSHPPTVPMVDEYAGGTVISRRSHRFPNQAIAPIQDGIGQVEQNSFVIDFLHMLFFVVRETGQAKMAYPFAPRLRHDARRVGQNN